MGPKGKRIRKKSDGGGKGGVGGKQVKKTFVVIRHILVGGCEISQVLLHIVNSVERKLLDR